VSVRLSVCLSICPSLSLPGWAHSGKPAAAGLLLWARPSRDIDWLLYSRRPATANAGSATLLAYVGSYTRTCWIRGTASRLTNSRSVLGLVVRVRHLTCSLYTQCRTNVCFASARDASITNPEGDSSHTPSLVLDYVARPAWLVGCREAMSTWVLFSALRRYCYYYYLLRPNAAQHNITITKTEETHKKVKTKIHKN